MSPTLPPLNTSSLLPLSNATYYSDEEEPDDTGFSDVETVALACFLTLLPLIFGVISYFGLRSCSRHCWLRWRRTVEPSELAKSLDKETSERSKSSHALLNDQMSQMKTSESEFSVVPTDDGDEAGNQTSKLAANGSIITMTMKNNHLIVETEERLEEAGVAGEITGDVPLQEVAVVEENTAIVHAVNTKTENDYQGVNTGLSTSDLSSSSEASTNRGYKYGTQEEYHEDEEFVNRQMSEADSALGRGVSRPSLDLGPSRTVVVGLENPAFLPTPADVS